MFAPLDCIFTSAMSQATPIINITGQKHARLAAKTIDKTMEIDDYGLVHYSAGLNRDTGLLR